MPRIPNKIDCSGVFPQGFEVFASIQDPRNSLPKREMRAALNPAYLEQLLSLPPPPCGPQEKFPVDNPQVGS